MRILLIGEYSRLHNSLKEGLEQLGHTVLLIGTGDGFKKFPVDIDIQSRLFEKWLLRKGRVLLYRLFGIDLCSIERGLRFYWAERNLESFDVVQLINENAIQASNYFEIFLVKRLRRKHKKLFLLSCGTDFISVSYAYQKKLKYSMFTPYFEGLVKNELRYTYILKKINRSNKRLHSFLFQQIDGVIASDLDYHIPLKGNKKYKGLIPNPVNISRFDFEAHDVSNKIIIFHGINSANYFSKGNYIFEKALKIIEEKHGDRVAVITTRDMPYTDYIEAYAQCDILMDQVFSYDQGYNALESMARGKVVFTGAEQEFLDFYHLNKNQVCINALPDIDSIVQELELLILEPTKILDIGKAARNFVIENHQYVDIAKRYINVWQFVDSQ